MNIKLIFYGEPESEYGNDIKETQNSIRDKKYFVTENMNEIFLAGEKISDLIKKHNLNIKDLFCFLPLDKANIKFIPTDFIKLDFPTLFNPYNNNPLLFSVPISSCAVLL